MNIYLVYNLTSKILNEYYKKYYGNYKNDNDIYVCFKIENNKIYVRYGEEIEFEEISLKKAIEEVKSIDKYISVFYKKDIDKLKEEINKIYIYKKGKK